MIEQVLSKSIYKLDFIDLNILEQVIENDYFMAFPILVKRLKRINVWNRGIIRRRMNRLRELKLIHFEDNISPIVIEAYQHKENELNIVKELLKKRLIIVR